ncbi:cysteine desulfurase family protein [Alicyclobacillus sp.]|uniref:cysteine desulfurase family protein n=1 Tax=Alicyclobacillus sp. TaxID=61169 RepID=UPI0025C63FF8|nr:cysteine desulfurase family protein [Alicyclobacillus sp.]
MEVYLDNAATTPLLPEAEAAIREMIPLYGNPSSLHRKGVEAERRLETARRQVLGALGVREGRIVFTGGGTEANNLAIFGTLKRHGGRGRHIVTTRIEHPSVLEPFRALERAGWRVTYVAPDRDGWVPAERVLEAVADDTVLVSVMHVNNETGAILPVQEIGRHLRQRPKVIFHVDGIQAFGKIPDCLRQAGADLYTVSGHKIGAPKGVGALYIRPGLEIEPVLHGGGQEGGLRSGTENTIGIAALGAAAEHAAARAKERYERVSAWCEQFIARLGQIPGCQVHRPREASPYIVSASFPGLRGEVLVHALESEGVFVSTGSACSSRGGHAKASHVLEAMGLTPAEVTGALRFSFGWHTEEAAVERAAQVIEQQVKWLYDAVGTGGRR